MSYRNPVSCVIATLIVLCALTPLPAQTRTEYAVILTDPPLAGQLTTRRDLKIETPAKAKLIQAQSSIRRAIESRHIRIRSSAQILVNAIFIDATEAEAQALRSIPGVSRVEREAPLHRELNRAVDLTRATAAWSALNGESSAGAGIKIGILDTGIDQSHAAFGDDSLTVPAGFPKGRAEELAYTNNKVIVARSYVAQLGAGDPAVSRPDDFSPRDRSGHGTAIAMIAAGVRHMSPAGSIVGVAPKAFLGNYKIFGSPGVNDITFPSIVIAALEDALQDGMDIVALPIGSPATYAPLAHDCPPNGSTICDPRADAVENVSRLGMLVVVPAGNDGGAGLTSPSLATIHTPGVAPSALTVGASTNSHLYFSSLRVGDGSFRALLGDGPKPFPFLGGPLRDASQTRDDGHACSPLPEGSLTSAIALVQRGNCDFATKVNHAQRAGAAAVVIYQLDGVDQIFSPAALSGTAIPAAMISNSDGVSLKQLIRDQPDPPAALDATLTPSDAQPDRIPEFSSRGPAIGDVRKREAPIKPELVAPASDIYTATQSFDPNGDLYNPTGYTAVEGTSFAVPFAAGAAALVKQLHPNFTVAQIKSAVADTASPDVLDGVETAQILVAGAGRLNVEAAVRTPAIVEPSTLAFGIIDGGTLPVSLAMQVTNSSGAAASFNLSVDPRYSDTSAQITLTPSQLQLQSNETFTVTVRLAGVRPPPGSYSGVIMIAAGSTRVRVPYLYLVSDGAPANLIPILNVGAGIPGEDDQKIGFKLIDRYGAPIQNTPVLFGVADGGGAIVEGDSVTDNVGAAAARVKFGPQPGEQHFTAQAGSMTFDFFGRVRPQPTINSGGVINAANVASAGSLAPGSIISILGSGLSESIRTASTPSLPLSLAGVSVSFDSAQLSLPGRIVSVSDRRVDVQIPWEFQGQDSVQIKVSLGPFSPDSSAVYTLPLAAYSPGIFEINDALGRPVTSANPAARGQEIRLLANGLGPVENQPATGDPGPTEPLARTRVLPTVTIGGVAAEVTSSALAPNRAGIYLVNVIVPAGVTPGVQPMVLSVNGIDTKNASLVVN